MEYEVINNVVENTFEEMDKHVDWVAINMDERLAGMYSAEKEATSEIVFNIARTIEAAKTNKLQVYKKLIENFVVTELQCMAGITDYAYDTALRYCVNIIVDGLCKAFGVVVAV